jgi:hypothetical protein
MQNSVLVCLLLAVVEDVRVSMGILRDEKVDEGVELGNRYMSLWRLHRERVVSSPQLLARIPLVFALPIRRLDCRR